MKLWLLAPLFEDVNDNPWDPWYDKAFGFVVRAETEDDARQIAHKNAGDENKNTFMGISISKTTTPWLDIKYSLCVPLPQEGEARLILRDFAAA